MTRRKSNHYPAYGATVTQFEREFAAYVGATHAIAMTNGTVTLEVALRALGIGPGEKVATTPLTMAATSMAILNVGAVPVYCDVDPRTWLMGELGLGNVWLLPVSLYGLHRSLDFTTDIDDAAQTLRPHGAALFTSYSFQRSKILNTGEGGMLVTDNDDLAATARSIASLGYDLTQSSRIDKAAIKSPDAVRHVRSGLNARMNDATAALGLGQLAHADELKATRRRAAALYREATAGCDWLTPQYVPDGWTHDYWCYTVALALPLEGVMTAHSPDGDYLVPKLKNRAWDWKRLADAIVRHGGEMPYGAWRLTYEEPAFRHLATDGTCPEAEWLQPSLMQFQTNDLDSADRNANALRRAIKELDG